MARWSWACVCSMAALLRGHLVLHLADLATQVRQTLLPLALVLAELAGGCRGAVELGLGDAGPLGDGGGLTLDRGESQVELPRPLLGACGLGVDLLEAALHRGHICFGRAELEEQVHRHSEQDDRQDSARDARGHCETAARARCSLFRFLRFENGIHHASPLSSMP